MRAGSQANLDRANILKSNESGGLMSNNQTAESDLKNLTIRIIAAFVVGIGIIAALSGCSPQGPSPSPVKPEPLATLPEPLVKELLSKGVSRVGLFAPGGQEIIQMLALFPDGTCETCTKILPGDPDYQDLLGSKADDVFDALVNPAEAAPASCYPHCTNCGKPHCGKGGGFCCPCP